MKELSLLDEAQLKAEFRTTYKEIGLSGCVQVLYELITAANILAEVMLEERNKWEKAFFLLMQMLLCLSGEQYVCLK